MDRLVEICLEAFGSFLVSGGNMGYLGLVSVVFGGKKGEQGRNNTANPGGWRGGRKRVVSCRMGTLSLFAIKYYWAHTALSLPTHTSSFVAFPLGATIQERKAFKDVGLGLFGSLKVFIFIQVWMLTSGLSAMVLLLPYLAGVDCREWGQVR